jgi:hypothetical protein
LGEEQVWIPTGLEPWVRSMPISGYVIMVAVNDVWPIISFEGKRKFIERMFRENIPRSNKGHKFTRCQA